MQNRRYKLRTSHIYLLALLYLFFLWAVLLIFGFTPTNDGEGYLEYAQQCLNEGQPYPTVSIYHTAPFIWNIGIINAIELSLWLFDSIIPLLYLLCALKALTALFLALTARAIMGHRTAIITLLLFILYPNNWGQSTMLSSEIPSTFLCVTCVYLIVNVLWKKEKTKEYFPLFFFCGLLLALANWFRPTATIFLLALILMLLFFKRNNKIKSTALLLSGYIVFIGIVGFSCYLRTGHFVYQARSYWFSMVDECYDEAEVAPHWNQPIWPKGTPRYIDHHEEMNCFQFDSIWRERSINWLKDHKTQYMKKIPGRLYYMYQSDYDYVSAFYSDKSKAENNSITIPYRNLLSEWYTLNRVQWLSLFNMILYLIILVLAFLGIQRLFFRAELKILFLPFFIVVGGTLSLVLVMHGETRFKEPLMPFIFLLAAIWLSYPKRRRI